MAIFHSFLYVYQRVSIRNRGFAYFQVSQLPSTLKATWNLPTAWESVPNLYPAQLLAPSVCLAPMLGGVPQMRGTKNLPKFDNVSVEVWTLWLFLGYTYFREPPFLFVRFLARQASWDYFDVYASQQLDCDNSTHNNYDYYQHGNPIISLLTHHQHAVIPPI